MNNKGDIRDVSPVVQKAFKNLLTMQDRYFYTESPRHEETECYKPPVGPGAACYKDDVSSFRIMGGDPGFPQARARDVPDHVVTNYKKSLLQGIEMVFPAKAVDAYLNDHLAEPDFGRGHVSTDRFYLHDFPRILPEPPQGKIDNPFRFSLEHDIRREFNDSGLHEIRHDRKNFTNKDLYDFYHYSNKKPEVIASFLFWQEHMANYCSELRFMIAEHCGLNPGTDKDEINKRFPVNHLVQLFESSVIMSNIPQYLGAYVLASGKGDKIESGDFSAGISSAMKAGVFRRKYQTEFGERQIVCPFATSVSKFLVGFMESANGKNETTIYKCYAKILSERQFPKISSICAQVREIIQSTLAESDPLVIAQIKGSIKNNKGVQCQLHA
jgi:hypothetical protein